MAVYLLQVVIASACITAVLLIPTSYCAPFVVIPGLGVKCSDAYMNYFTKHYEMSTGSTGNCVDGGDIKDNMFFIPLLKQTSTVCERIKKMNHLRNGYNIVGLSQGGLVARGVIEFCDRGPPVKNFISLGAPQAGISTFPRGAPGLLFPKLAIYTSYVQNKLAPSGYVKIPSRIKAYMKGSKFLPKLNNEIAGKRNPTYKERFSSLEKLLLVMFDKDTVIIPKESAWFGYFPDGASSPVLPAHKTRLYTEDWIGLKKLDVAGKVRFVISNGKHLEIDAKTREVIISYLRN